MNDALGGFIEAACVPLDSGHASGTLEHAQDILSAHPELADQSIHAAAILGHAAAVRRFLDLHAGDATAKGGPAAGTCSRTSVSRDTCASTAREAPAS